MGNDYKSHQSLLISCMEFVALGRMKASEFASLIDRNIFSQGNDFEYIKSLLLGYEKTSEAADELTDIVKEIYYDGIVKYH